MVILFFMPITECFHLTKTYIFFSNNVFSKGADMDVCLTNYGHCNFLSGKHACIFYDEVCPHTDTLNSFITAILNVHLEVMPFFLFFVLSVAEHQAL